jgi:di- and tripeptidase
MRFALIYNNSLSASLSRDLATDESSPRLMHLLHEQNHSVLSLFTDDKHIYSGSQCNDISVCINLTLSIYSCAHWQENKKTYRLVNTLKGRTGSILFLEYVPMNTVITKFE